MISSIFFPNQLLLSQDLDGDYIEILRKSQRIDYLKIHHQLLPPTAKNLANKCHWSFVISH
jgi:hypothetical protein